MLSKKVDVSIVIPAFNEEKRLPLFLDRLIPFCNSSKKIYEIIIVDDGSSDKTFEIAASYKTRFNNLQIIRVRENTGKGYAVGRGFLISNGEIYLFIDADGSIEPEEIEKNIHYILEDGYDIFVGSRGLKGKDQVVKGKWYRKFIGYVFSFFVQTFLLIDIKDTQCGFKIFKSEIAKILFARSHLRGFAFDVEILYLAYKIGYKVKEVPVSWHHVDGCKVNLLTDPIRMFFNILQIRNWHCTPINSFARHISLGEYQYMYELENYHWWFVSRKNLVVNLIKSLNVSLPVILDVGCGTGGNLLSFSKFSKAYGIDISQKAVEFCRKRGLENVTQCPAEEIKYQDKAFDIITCLDVLEHILNPHQALLELKRVLKDDGKIMITVPAFRILWSQHDEALCHLRRYTRNFLSHDLQEAGFNIEKMSYFFFTSFFVVAPIRIMRKILVSKQKLHSDTTTLPPKFLNEFLKFLFNIEIKVFSNFGAPFGTTLYAIVSKMDNSLKFQNKNIESRDNNIFETEDAEISKSVSNFIAQDSNAG